MDDSNGEFEIVENTSMTSPAGKKPAGKSMLASIPPPSELPSFIASPLPISSASGPLPALSIGSALPPTISSSQQSMAPPPTTLTPPFVPPSTSSQGSIPPPMIPLGAPPLIPVTMTGSSQVLKQPQLGHPIAAVTSQPSIIETQQPHTSSISVDASAGSHFGHDHQPLQMGDGNGWLGWIKGTVQSVSHRVAEKAKTSMDTMITTLDPQMKDFINSGGDVDIVIASDKEVKISPVREAFQKTFGKATVNGIGSQCSGIASQPVGFEAALKSAEERINNLRSSGNIHPQQPVIALEGFIVEFLPDEWYELSLLLLDDPYHDILLQTYTQVTPVPTALVDSLKAVTPEDYAQKSTGFFKTVGQAASESLNVHHTIWQETLTTVSRRDTIFLAARTLAGLYKSRLPTDVI